MKISIYPSNRNGNVNRGVKRQVDGGAMLGPTLWNLLYHEVMGQTEEGAMTKICYVDDLPIVISLQELKIEKSKK